MHGEVENARNLEHDREIARFIHSSSQKDLLANFAAFLVLAFFFCTLKGNTDLLVWALLCGVALFYRLVITLKLREMLDQDQGKTKKYIRFFWSGVLFYGLVFGSAGFVLFPQENLLHQVFLAIILWGTSTTSIGYYVPSFGVSAAYTLLMSLPVTLCFFIRATGDDLQAIIGILGTIYCAMQCVFSLKMNRYYTDNLMLQLDNKVLIKEFVHEVKSRLASEI